MSDIKDLIYTGDKNSVYAASTASTWIWAPALFVSSAISYQYGILGLLFFIVPNAIDLIVFGFVAKKFIADKKYASYSVLQLINRSSKRQKNIHFAIGFIVAFCSTMVQFIGMNIIINTWIPNANPIYGCLLLGLTALAIIWKNGIKACIISDYYKYIVITISSILLLTYAILTVPFDFNNIKIYDPKDLDYLIGFGVITCISLFSSPYVDQTMWQRAFSMDKKNIIKVFCLSSLMLSVVPICFGLTGIIFSASIPNIANWQITDAVGTGWLGVIIAVAAFFTLLSTIDSNCCAISSFFITEFNIDGRWGIVLSLLIGTLIVTFIPLTITQLFLIYGSIRTVGCIPTLLIGFDKFNEKRLFISTIAALIFGSLGYLILSLMGYNNAYICTLIALFLPLMGFSNKPNNNSN